MLRSHSGQESLSQSTTASKYITIWEDTAFQISTAFLHALSDIVVTVQWITAYLEVPSLQWVAI